MVLMDEDYIITVCEDCNGFGKKEWIEKSFCSHCNGTGKVVKITKDNNIEIKPYNG